MITSRVFISFVKQCLDDNCPQIAASLAFTTLLTLIPLTALIYKIYSSIFIDVTWQLNAQELVFNSLSPTMAEQVKRYLFESMVHAKGITIIGFVMLFISVVIMMYTIDSALNSIWKIHKPRYLVRRILVYIALLIFGPLAISFSLFASAYLASLPLIAESFGKTVDSSLLNWLPFMITWIAFTMLYRWVPDCEVKWLSAFSGGTIAACLLELAKTGFTLYVSYFPTYEILYGALASIPLLLIWIYFTWLIVLIGAEIAHFMQE
jgi:membrane protein